MWNRRGFLAHVGCAALFGPAASIGATSALAASAKSEAARVALVVGIEGYGGELKLGTPVRDAREIAGALRDIGFDVIELIDPDYAQLTQGLQEFSLRTANARAAIFYYAGHGLQFVRDGANFATNLFLPKDFSWPAVSGAELRKAVIARTVNLDEVKKAMEAARVRIVILDACRDNPFPVEQLALNTNNSGAAADAALGATSRPRGLARSLSSTQGQPAIQSVGKISDGAQGYIISYATQAGQTALDGDGSHSPFTTGLLANIKLPGLTVGEMLRRVASYVWEKTNAAQWPLVEDSIIGNYYLVAPRPTPTAQVDNGDKRAPTVRKNSGGGGGGGPVQRNREPVGIPPGAGAGAGGGLF